jgi:divalent metal cation (Fe/Co/Zn/Cd) transporter
MSLLELSGVFVGTFLLVSGIFFIVMAAKKWVDSTTKYYIMGVFFMLFGLGVLGFIVHKSMAGASTPADE